MATLRPSSSERANTAAAGFNFNLNLFIRENLTSSWWMTIWLIFLTFFVGQYTYNRLAEAPVSTIIVLIIWFVSVVYTAYSEITRRHSDTTLWLKNNLYNSITNVEITLFLVLLLLSVLFGLYRYSVTLASFSTIPATDNRAEFVSQNGQEYCFNLGYIDSEISRTTLLEPQTKCFPRSSFSPDLSPDNIGDLTLGVDPANFCLDEQPDIDGHGVTCFSSVGNDPGFYQVTYRYAGANWGAVRANFTTLMVFRFTRDELWRVWACIILLVGLAMPSIFVYRDSFENKSVRRLLTYTWLLSPILLYILLRGATPPGDGTGGQIVLSLIALVVAGGMLYLNRYVNQEFPQEKGEAELRRLGRIALSLGVAVVSIWAAISIIQLILITVGSIRVGGEQLFSPIDPDRDWGGFLLTLIITAFSIIVSFPLGVALALGRRSQITGIPPWLTYPLAIGFAIFALFTITPDLASRARNNFELAVAYWPIGLILVAFLFQTVWKGNVVSAFSTLYIEFIRGMPLITVLFLSIILFPIFLPPNMEILNVWRVMWAFTLFSAAYLAENVRGGLQAIPKGQYEAADSLGLSTFNKYRLIILPQALRIVIPAITNQYIGLFKDTTLVAIVGLLDVLGVANAISAQPQWLGVRREAYLTIGVIYFVICALIAAYSARLEKRSGLGTR